MSELSNVFEVRENVSDQGALDAAEALQLAASDKTVTISKDEMSKVNVDRHQYGDKNKDFVTRYPTGVRTVHEGGSVRLEAPPGGSQAADGKTIYDANKKEIAKQNDDGSVTITTKYGKFTESKDGSVNFAPNSKAPADNNLQGKHKQGEIKKTDFEDYGLATDGTSVSFPNGMKWTKTTDGTAGQVTRPAEYKEERGDEKVRTDGDGNEVRTLTKNGQLIYKWDSTGLHIPVSDGTITVTADGKASFEPNAQAADKKDQKQSALLPPVDIVTV